MNASAMTNRAHPSRRRLGVVAAVLASVLTAGLWGPGSAATADPLVVAVLAPANGTTTGFAPRSLVAAQGTSMDLIGADTTAHNLVCEKKKKVKKGKRRFRRPVCASGFAAAGQTSRVEGVETLKPGTYALLCQLHPQMTVELTVVGAS